MIKTILDKTVVKTTKEVDKAAVVTEVKLLLDGDNLKEGHILAEAFPNSHNIAVQEMSAEREHIKSLENIHHGSIYTIAEIKDICMKYRLRFLPSVKYKGTVPAELIFELRRKLVADNGFGHLENGNVHDFKYNLFVMAPGYMFNVGNYTKTKREKLAEIKRLKKEDPACFVKINEDKYMFLKEWGNSFSPFRRILGACTAKKRTLSRLFFLAWCAYAFCGFEVVKFAAEHGWSEKTGAVINGWFCILCIFSAAWFLVSIISWVLPPNSGFFMSLYKYYNEGFWSVDENVATENNWNKL